MRSLSSCSELFKLYYVYKLPTLLVKAQIWIQWRLRFSISKSSKDADSTLLGPHFECISLGDAFFPTVVDKCGSLSSPRAGPGSCSFWALWPLAQHSARHTVRAQSTSADSRWFSGGLAKWQKPWAKKLSQKNLLYDSFFPECGLSTFHKLAPRILPPTHRGRHYHHRHPTDEEIASVRWRTMPKVTVHALSYSTSLRQGPLGSFCCIIP